MKRRGGRGKGEKRTAERARGGNRGKQRGGVKRGDEREKVHKRKMERRIVEEGTDN